MKRGSRGVIAWIVLLWIPGACGFGAPQEGASSDARVDAPPPPPDPVTCGDLKCDPHASCVDGPPRCVCGPGYAGDGLACADVDECATGNGGCAAACVNSDGGHTCYTPTTCEDVRAMVPGWQGGSVVLYVAGDPAKPWTAHCTAEDREYLPLVQNNYSMYRNDPGQPDVVTTFTRIRIDPGTLVVDIADQTYSTSTGTLNHGATAVTSMPYAVAMDCRGPNSTAGRARIDLAGTPFVVNDQFTVTGSAAAGTVTPADNGRRLDIAGGGNCGWNAPTGTPFNPFNSVPASPILQLEHRP